MFSLVCYADPKEFRLSPHHTALLHTVAPSSEKDCLVCVTIGIVIIMFTYCFYTFSCNDVSVKLMFVILITCKLNFIIEGECTFPDLLNKPSQNTCPLIFIDLGASFMSAHWRDLLS